jgi:hypothetical protein
MAAHDLEACLLEEGVVVFEDPEIGKRVSEFEEKGFPFQTEEGLDFCQRSTLNDAASSI